jgi:hypothetical protein
MKAWDLGPRTLLLLALFLKPIAVRAFDCNEILSTQFAQSFHGETRHGVNPKFNEWMRASAENALREMHDNRSLNSILSEISRSRQPPAHLRGLGEIKDGVLGYDSTNAAYSSIEGFFSDARLAFSAKIIEMLKARGASTPSELKGHRIWSNSFRFRNGKTERLNDMLLVKLPRHERIHYFPRTQKIRYSVVNGETARRIRDEILIRAERLREGAPYFADHPSRLEAEKEFLILAKAFFASMPYQQGSASVGRIFFTALGQRLFAQPGFTLDADIDVWALVMNDEQFLPAMLEKSFGRMAPAPTVKTKRSLGEKFQDMLEVWRDPNRRRAPAAQSN